MKYGELKSNILSILHSDDYDFTLKLYDGDGNTTLDPEEAYWIYITNKNIMFELPSDDEAVMCIWKEKEIDDDETLSKVIKRTRELCILNGVSLQVRLFDDLNRRKIYNLIQNAINSRKENAEMNETVETSLAKCLFEVCTKIKRIKKSSDNFISEALMSKNTKTIMENYVNLTSSVKNIGTKHFQSLFNKLFLENSYSKCLGIVKSFNKQFPDEAESINSRKEDLKNAVTFVKECYLNNRSLKDYGKVIKIMEHCVVYPMNSKNDNENMRKAYNHLISVCEGVTRGIDVLRMIKKHNICETYKVTKDELLEMWLSKSVDKPIEKKVFLMFESPMNKAVALPMEMKSSLSTLASHFDSNGVVMDKQAQKIIDETVKFNDINDLMENYFYNPSLKKYASTLNEILKECLEQLNGGYAKEDIFEGYNEGKIDYSKELNAIQEKTGIKHNGLKYIAIKEAMENQIKEHHVTLDKMKDERILKEGLSSILPLKKAKTIAKAIVETRLTAVKPLNEDASDKMSLVKSMVDNLFSTNEEVKTSINECVFYIASNPARYNGKEKFVSTLKKYII